MVKDNRRWKKGITQGHRGQVSMTTIYYRSRRIDQLRSVLLFCFLNLHFYKSFYYCQFRQIMLNYRYQQGRRTNRFVLPCLHRRDTLARVAREKSSTGIYHVVFRGINRQIIFEDDQDRMRFLDTLEKNKERLELLR